MSENVRVSIAPMMDITNRHFRFLLRLLSPKIWLYTEMLTASAVMRGDLERLLGFNEDEHPLVLQLGGSDPTSMAAAAKKAQDYGYDEINLNIGCPSDRVLAGAFGACLMKEATLVAECVARIKEVVAIPVTIKTRIGIDDEDSFDFLHDFIETTRQSGCTRYIIHARKAWLQGLSPKQNREIPPLNYQRVHDIKQHFSQLEFELNGGIKTLDDLIHCRHLDGVMLGRIAQENATLAAEMAAAFLNNHPIIPAEETVFHHYMNYASVHLEKGVPFTVLIKPLFSLFQGKAGAKQWRRRLSHLCSSKFTSEQRFEQLRGFVQCD